VRRSYLGIAAQDVPLPRRVVRHFALPRDAGVLVTEAVTGGAAERAGLRDGDLIIGFNGAVVERDRRPASPADKRSDRRADHAEGDPRESSCSNCVVPTT
jgi:S1-C subfamily serine protease